MPISLNELTQGVKHPLVFQCQTLQQNCPTCLPFPETLQYLCPPLVQAPCAIKKGGCYWNWLLPLTASPKALSIH